MTKKVTLDKTEYDQMEKEIERLKSVNEELVKGASVVLDPQINIIVRSENHYEESPLRCRLLGHGNIWTNEAICTNDQTLPNSSHIKELYKILETQIRDSLGDHCEEETKTLQQKKEDFETVRRRSLETQEKQKEILFKEHQEALDKLEIVKKGYEARPKNRYIVMGVFIGAMLTYLIM